MKSSVIALFSVLLLFPSISYGQCIINGSTITVITAADVGTGSLREAIVCANQDPSLTDIVFDIPGTGPHIIELWNFEFDQIATSNLTIDATTQPGWTMGNIAIIEGPFFYDLYGFNISPNANNITIRGFEIRGFPSSGIQVGGANTTITDCVIIGNGLHGINVNANNCTIQNNLIGIEASGTTASPAANKDA